MFLAIPVGESILEGSVGMKEREQVENSFHCLGNSYTEKPENLGSCDNFYGFCYR